MKKLNSLFQLIFVLVIFVAAIAGCAPAISKSAPPPPPDTAPANERFYCTSPESDNGKMWGLDSQVCYDTQVYTVTVKILGDVESNQTVSGSSFSYNGYGSGHLWTDGKGVLPVKFVRISPTPDWIDDLTLPYILKTTDLGAMGLPVGATVTFLCNHDVEVLSPAFTGQTLTKDRLTDELDDCRLDVKSFVPAE